MTALGRYVAPDGSVHFVELACNAEGLLRVSARPAMGDLTVGHITASGQTVVCHTGLWSNVMAHMVATDLSGHNVTFEGSLDSTDGADGNWFTIQAVRSNANTVETASGALAATPAYGWELSTNGLSYVRVRATAHTGGTASWKFLPAPYATEPIPAAQVSASQPVTISGNASSGSSTQYKVISAATVNASSVKNAAGSIYAIVASNNSAQWRYLKLYNKAGIPTVGTDTPVYVMGIPPGATIVLANVMSIRLATGIALAITAGITDNDATAIGAGEVVVSLSYT